MEDATVKKTDEKAALKTAESGAHTKRGRYSHRPRAAKQPQQSADAEKPAQKKQGQSVVKKQGSTSAGQIGRPAPQAAGAGSGKSSKKRRRASPRPRAGAPAASRFPRRRPPLPPPLRHRRCSSPKRPAASLAAASRHSCTSSRWAGSARSARTSPCMSAAGICSLSTAARCSPTARCSGWIL